MMTTRRIAFDSATIAFLTALIAMMWARVAALHLNPLDLYFDEAQYWLWSRSFDWGYFTKPPMIAWVIAATTALFGDAEWAVRLAAPLAHGVAAFALFALGRSIYGAWAGFWAGLGWLLLPGVFLSSAVISTDALMLPFWSIALLATWRLVTTRAWLWAAIIGLAVGLGTQAKYAMLYFIPCAALAAWGIEPLRQAMGRGRAIVAAIIALLVIAPNAIWNAQHGFVTAQHTVANARFDIERMFSFKELLEFVSGQFGVIGPLLFLALLGLLWRAMRGQATLALEDRFLLAFMLPPVLVVTLIAFLSRANANWAAVAYPAIVVWVSGVLVRTVSGRRFLTAAAAANALLGATVVAVPMFADPELANRIKGVRTTRAWEETAAEIARLATARSGEAPFTAILVDDRITYFELTYYWRQARRAGAPLPPLRMWVLLGEAHNSAEALDPMRAEEGGRVLVAHLQPGYLPLVADDFTVFRTVEPLNIPLGGGFTREMEISIGEGFAPAPRDDRFHERLERLREQ